MRRAFLLLITTVLAAGAAWAAFGARADAPGRAVREAADRLAAGDADGALACAELAFRTAHTSGEAAAFAALTRAATENLPAAFGRMEAAARRDPADAESALGAGLLARFLAQRFVATDAERARLTERSREWLREAVRRADAGVLARPGSFGCRTVAVAARIASGDTSGAHAEIAGLVPRTQEETEERALLRAAAFAARGQLDAALAALRDASTPDACGRIAAAIARVSGWREAAADSPRDAGLRAWREGNVARSVELLSSWIDEHPDDPVALAALAAASAHLGAAAETLRRQAQLATADPEGPAAPYFTGCHLLASGRAPEAEAAFLVAAQRAPRSIAVLRGIVQARLERGAAAEAVDAVRGWRSGAAGTESPPSVVFLLGVALDASGDAAGAEAALRAACCADPRDAEAPDRLAELLVECGRSREALVIVRKALAASPHSSPLRLRLALALAASGERSEAESVLGELVREEPASVPARVHLARLFLGRGAVDEAERAFEQALELDPQRVEAHLGLLAIARAAGRIDPFRERVRRAGEERPRSGALAFVAGAAAASAGDLDHAEALYRRALALDPRCGLAANNLAWLVAVDRGQPRAALHLADDAVRLLPRSAQALDTRGWVRFLCRDVEAAEADLARARARLPLDPDVAVRHARSLLAVGRTEDAAGALAAALAAAPTIRQDPAFRAAARQAQMRFE